jgi:hypothetical protein
MTIKRKKRDKTFPLFGRGFLTETNGKWGNGDIYMGFNISRVFTIVKPKEFRDL